MIRIYFSSYSKKLSSSCFSSYLYLLPEELKQKILRYREWKDQHAALYGKLLLMKALAEAGFQSDLLNLNYTKYGRPYIKHTPDFNISHAGSFVVCAIANQCSIGIDIEQIKSVDIGDFKGEFSKDEWNHITASCNSDYWFYYYWTAKEAAIKADGRGLGLSLDNIIMKNNMIKINKKDWFIKKVDIDEEYLLHIATDRVVEREINISEIAF